MQIVYDERKRRSNIEKHGYDFADLTLEFFDGALVAPAKAARFKAVGRFGSRLVAIVFSPLGREGIAIVSMRTASRGERMRYAEYRKDGETP